VPFSATMAGMIPGPAMGFLPRQPTAQDGIRTEVRR